MLYFLYFASRTLVRINFIPNRETGRVLQPSVARRRPLTAPSMRLSVSSNDFLSAADAIVYIHVSSIVTRDDASIKNDHRPRAIYEEAIHEVGGARMRRNHSSGGSNLALFALGFFQLLIVLQALAFHLSILLFYTAHTFHCQGCVYLYWLQVAPIFSCRSHCTRQLPFTRDFSWPFCLTLRTQAVLQRPEPVRAQFRGFADLRGLQSRLNAGKCCGTK